MSGGSSAAGAGAGGGSGILRVRICKNTGTRKLTLVSVPRSGFGTATEWATFQAKARALLGVPELCRFFDKSGAEIRALEALRDNDLVVCSAGESFRPLKRKPATASATAHARDLPTVALPLPSMMASLHASSSSPVKSPAQLTRAAVERHNSRARLHDTGPGAAADADADAASDAPSSILVGTTFIGSVGGGSHHHPHRPSTAQSAHRSRSTDRHAHASSHRRPGSAGPSGRRSPSLRRAQVAAAAAAAAAAIAGPPPSFVPATATTVFGLDDPFGGSGADARAMALPTTTQLYASPAPGAADSGVHVPHHRVRSYTPEPGSRNGLTRPVLPLPRSTSPFLPRTTTHSHSHTHAATAHPGAGVPPLLLPVGGGPGSDSGTELDAPSQALLDNAAVLNRQLNDAVAASSGAGAGAGTGAGYGGGDTTTTDDEQPQHRHSSHRSSSRARSRDRNASPQPQAQPQPQQFVDHPQHQQQHQPAAISVTPSGVVVLPAKPIRKSPRGSAPQPSSHSPQPQQQQYRQSLHAPQQRSDSATCGCNWCCAGCTYAPPLPSSTGQQQQQQHHAAADRYPPHALQQSADTSGLQLMQQFDDAGGSAGVDGAFEEASGGGAVGLQAQQQPQQPVVEPAPHPMMKARASTQIADQQRLMAAAAAHAVDGDQPGKSVAGSVEMTSIVPAGASSASSAGAADVKYAGGVVSGAAAPVPSSSAAAAAARLSVPKLNTQHDDPHAAAGAGGHHAGANESDADDGASGGVSGGFDGGGFTARSRAGLGPGGGPEDVRIDMGEVVRPRPGSGAKAAGAAADPLLQPNTAQINALRRLHDEQRSSVLDGSSGHDTVAVALGLRTAPHLRKSLVPVKPLVHLDLYLRVMGYGYLDLQPHAPRTCADIAATLWSWFVQFVCVAHTALAVLSVVYLTDDDRRDAHPRPINATDDQVILLLLGVLCCFTALRWRLQRTVAALYLTLQRQFDIEDSVLKQALSTCIPSLLVGKAIVVLLCVALVLVGSLLPTVGVAENNPVQVLFIADSRTDLWFYVHWALWLWGAVFTVPVCWDFFMMSCVVTTLLKVGLEPFRLSISRSWKTPRGQSNAGFANMALHTKVELYHRATSLVRAACMELQFTVALFLIVPFSALVLVLLNALQFGITYYGTQWWGVVYVLARIVLCCVLFVCALVPLLAVNDAFDSLRAYLDSQWVHCALTPIEHLTLLTMVGNRHSGQGHGTSFYTGAAGTTGAVAGGGLLTPNASAGGGGGSIGSSTLSVAGGGCTQWTVYGWVLTGAVARWVVLITGVCLAYLLVQYRSTPF